MNQVLFDWSGCPPASKSILNRLLILRSFEPRISIVGESDCEDVVKMSAALACFEAARRETRRETRGKTRREAELDCGAAGTVLRFLAARVSREPGRWVLTGDRRLFDRPHAPLIEALAALGVRARMQTHSMTVETDGWRAPARAVPVDRSASSQFASALALAGVDLPFDLELAWQGESVSDGYWEMTSKVAARAGLSLRADERGARIAAAQTLSPAEIEAEPDVSSAFALAALGAVGGRARLLRFPFDGWQPDLAFAPLLARMGARVERHGADLTIAAPAQGLSALREANLKDSPDLFPVLAALCGFAGGVSRLTGAPHLAHKESARIDSSRRLLAAFGVSSRPIAGGLEIDGLGARPGEATKRELDPEGDHRLAMAAAVANLARRQRGAEPIAIADRGVVGKSFPGFWRELERGLR